VVDASEGLSSEAHGLWRFRRFVRRLMFQTIHDVAVMLDREQEGREASPTAGILDSQSIKPPMAEKCGYDAGKKVLGRKRHIAVVTSGRLLMVNLTPADISDSVGAQMIVDAVRKRWPWVKHLFADGAYDRGKLMDKVAFRGFTLEIVRRLDAEPGFRCSPAMGGRAHLRLDDPLPSSRARLRAPDRRLRGNDLRRPRKHPAQAIARMSVLKRALSGRFSTQMSHIETR
jgi:hypothetical protein